VVNGIIDALRPMGVRDITMPCTPQRVWQAIQAARGNAVGETGDASTGMSPDGDTRSGVTKTPPDSGGSAVDGDGEAR
jgi:carbon-monoxide dehydrogenase large subunit